MIGAGIAGLASAVRLAALGHEVTVLEQAAAAGGKCGRVELGGYRFDSGASLVTMPWVFAELFAATGGALDDELELMRVEPGTSYRFADGSSLRLGADLAPTLDELDRWSAGAAEDWVRFLGTAAQMWRASQPFLDGPPPWPPRRPRPGERTPDPRDLARVRPWQTLRGLARRRARDPRLRLVIERFATYAGADPRRAPAALALAGYVEHAFGAWHVRGGIYALVEALTRRLADLGDELRLQAAVERICLSGGRVEAVECGGERIPCEVVVSSADAERLDGELLGQAPRPRRERSLSGFALMLGVRGRTPGLAHHNILFPSDYDAEFDDVFVHRRPVRDPTIYLAASSVSDAAEAPPDCENWFVLVNAPTQGDGLDWDFHADAYEQALLDRLAARGLDPRARLEVRARRTPADLERETGAAGGAIYGAAPHGRLGTLGRPGNRSPAARGLYLVGGTTHPGGGLPLVALSAKIVATEVGPAV